MSANSTSSRVDYEKIYPIIQEMETEVKYLMARVRQSRKSCALMIKGKDDVDDFINAEAGNVEETIAYIKHLYRQWKRIVP